MGVNYLDPAEYQRFGLGTETADDLVLAASAVIDGHCRRATLGVTQYVERIRFRGLARSLQLSHAPLTAVPPAQSALVSVRVRWGRFRSETCLTPLQDAAQILGVCGSWSSIDTTTIEVSADGLLQFSPNPLAVPFDEAEVTYTAGFATLPDAVKAACAQIVRNAQATPALNVRDSRMDRMRLQYFSASLIDESTAAMLRPYVAQRVG